MKCPYCESENNTVVNSYPKARYPNGHYRRRKCMQCRRIFGTVEEVATEDIYREIREKASRKAAEKRKEQYERIGFV